jgi:hypothetical protein
MTKKGGYTLPDVGAPPESIAPPTESGCYWVKTADYVWEVIPVDEPDTYPNRRKNWTQSRYSWQIVELRDGSFYDIADECGFDWEEEHVVRVGPRLKHPEEV